MNSSALRRLIPALVIALLGCTGFASHPRAQPAVASDRPLLASPIWVYNNWSAYDELSDSVPLTEALAMRELREIVRLKRAGVRFDYYMMDAFWYDSDGGYRKWRADSWPQGPDRWIAECQANGIKPGLWFSTNTLTHLRAAPQWQDSLDTNGWAMSLSAGGFLADFMDVLQFWYDRGFRMFKFDMADFDAVAAGGDGAVTPFETRMRNIWALHAALEAFRRKYPDIVLVGFNGLVGDVGSVATPVSHFDVRWLDVLDSLYSGDPRPSNVPEMDFWRSVDIYSDHMVRSFEQAGIPLRRIDSTNFMIGNTGTNYRRGTAAWQGSLLLAVAHGSWINTVHGNLEFLDEDAARWLAKVQSIYEPLQREGITKSFGGIPGDAQPYGFGSAGARGTLYTVVNPLQRVRTVRLPQLAPWQRPIAEGRVLFHDAGFAPVLDGNTIRLGPGQLALVGFGAYADPSHDLGAGSDILVPRSIEPLPARFTVAKDVAAEPAEPLKETAAPLTIETDIMPPITGDLRIVLRQRNACGAIMRSFSTQDMGQYFVIGAEQDGRPLRVQTRYGKVIWSGLSWAVGEIRHDDIMPDEPLHLRLSSRASDPSFHLEGQVYQVNY
jgi:hypothetical protein